MKTILLFACLVAVSLAAPVVIRVNVFTGSSNPEIVVEGNLLLRQFALGGVKPNLETARPLPEYRIGYSGFEVMDKNHGQIYVIYNNAKLERVLLDIVRPHIQNTVAEHIASEIDRVQSLSIPATYHAPSNPTFSQPCVAPIRGPDNETVYDPSHDDCGWFVSHQTENNCYNYGNDIVTNTFAQPGRGSGQKWKQNTCADIRASAERDGLVWAGTVLPKKNPDEGHYVALLIWPDTNFHWIRFDSTPAGYWSHKAGQTAVKNVDNRGQKITDPSKSDFSPWTQFCGYMTTLPSKVTINQT